MGSLLNTYLQQCDIAVLWRAGAHILNMEPSTYKEQVDALTRDTSLVFPAYVTQAILSRRTKVMHAEQHWQGYAACMLPFRSEEAETGQPAFNHLEPTLASMPRVLAWRINSFVTSHFGEVVCPLLYEGEQTLSQVQKVSQAMHDEFDALDRLMLQKPATKLANDTLSVCKALMAICTLPFDSSCQDDLNALAPGSYTMNNAVSNPIAVVGTALQKSPFYEKRRKQMCDAMPVILEQEDKVAGHIVFLDSIGDDYDVEENDEWVHTFTCMLDDMSRILGKVAEVTVHPFATRLNEKLILCCEKKMKKVDALSKESSAQIQKMLVHASVAFPDMTAVPKWQLAVADTSQASTILAHIQSLHTVVDAANAKPSADDLSQAEMCAVKDAAKLVAGKELPVALACSIELLLISSLHKYVDMNPGHADITALANMTTELAKHCCAQPKKKALDDVKTLAVAIQTLKMQHEKFDKGEGEATCLKKALVDLKALADVKIDMRSWDAGDAHLVEILFVGKHLLAEMEVYAASLAEKQKAMAVARLEDACAKLEVIKDGSAVHKPWSKELNVNCTIEVWSAKAADVGLDTLNLDELESVIQAVVASSAVAVDAKSDAGDVDYVQLQEKVHSTQALTYQTYSL